MKTYKWNEVFAENSIWVEQKAKVEAMNRIIERLDMERNVALEIGDNEEARSLQRRMQGYYLGIESATAKLDKIELAIKQKYNFTFPSNRSSSWDYSRYLDDEYFIEKIDLDGYLRGNIL